MALSDDALITDITVVRDYLGEPKAAAGKIEPIVNAVSAIIADHTQRQFWPEPRDSGDPPVTKKFRYDGTGYMSLAPYELRELEPAGVVMYTDYAQGNWYTLADPSTVAESEYRLEPRNGDGRDGTYYWMVLPETGEFGLVAVGITGQGNIMRRIARGIEVSITGRWGMTEPPPEAVMALLITVSSLWKDPEGYANRSIAGMQISTVPFTSLPIEAQAMLSGLKRNRVT